LIQCDTMIFVAEGPSCWSQRVGTTMVRLRETECIYTRHELPGRLFRSFWREFVGTRAGNFIVH
jgi:hypothetical protein